MDTRVEVLHFRLDSIIGTVGRNALNNNLVPDFILPKTCCCRYGGSDGFPNSRAVRPDDREGRRIVFDDRLDVVIGGELYTGNKRLLDYKVDSVSKGKVVGVV